MGVRQMLLRRPVDVALQERVRGIDPHLAFQRQPSGGACPFKPWSLNHSAVYSTPGLIVICRDDLVGVRHAGDVLRADEGCDLDTLQPGFRQRIDQRDLAFGGDRAFLDLETLARAFLGDHHAARNIGHGLPFHATEIGSAGLDQ